MLAAVPAAAQVGELGLTGGVTYYIGDLNPYKHYPKHTHLGGGIDVPLQLQRALCRPLSKGLYSNLEAYDRDSPTTRCNSCATWASVQCAFRRPPHLLEVNFFKYRGPRQGQQNLDSVRVRRAGYFHTNPQNLLNDTWYDLQPLGTEGQGTGNGAGYGLNQILHSLRALG
jgi:hypothetical protein